MQQAIIVSDDRTRYRNSVLNILGSVGDTAETLPELHRVIRVNNAGYTLPAESTKILPENIEDIYIGRIIVDGVPSLNQFIAYQKTNVGGRKIYLLVATTDLDKLQSAEVVGMYDMAANQRNYHALWFRSLFGQYMETNPDWRAALPLMRSELDNSFKSLIYLGQTLKIPRFSAELEQMGELLVNTGFVAPSHQTMTDYIY